MHSRFAPPVGSKLINKRNDERNYEIHRRKLQEMRSTFYRPVQHHTYQVPSTANIPSATKLPPAGNFAAGTTTTNLQNHQPSQHLSTLHQQSHSFVINKRKREQLLENRFTEIERENRILLEKITNIMQREKTIGARESGPSAVHFTHHQSPKSLNTGLRKKQM